jgi:hypothetical protein
MGIKGLKISMIVSISFDIEAMPRLNPQQREQAIGRLHAGQPQSVSHEGREIRVFYNIK